MVDDKKRISELLDKIRHKEKLIQKLLDENKQLKNNLYSSKTEIKILEKRLDNSTTMNLALKEARIKELERKLECHNKL